jgi:hypothetical protein
MSQGAAHNGAMILRAEAASMNAPESNSPANSGAAAQPLPSAPDADPEMNEVLLGLAWMLAARVIRKAKAAAAAGHRA